MNGTLNKVMLIGRVADAIKLTYFDSENCVGRFVLATDDVSVNKQTQEKHIITEWHHIVVRNKAAELFEKHLKKGDLLYVEGKIRTRLQRNGGSERHITEILVTDFTFLPSGNTAK